MFPSAQAEQIFRTGFFDEMEKTGGSLKRRIAAGAFNDLKSPAAREVLSTTAVGNAVAKKDIGFSERWAVGQAKRDAEINARWDPRRAVDGITPRADEHFPRYRRTPATEQRERMTRFSTIPSQDQPDNAIHRLRDARNTNKANGGPSIAQAGRQADAYNAGRVKERAAGIDYGKGRFGAPKNVLGLMEHAAELSKR